MRSAVSHPALIALLSVGCFGEPAATARPDVQRLVDYYTPGIAIGGRVSRAAHARFALRPAPYFGYRDSTYIGPDGVRDLALRMNVYVDDAAPTVSRWARVTDVILQLPDTQSLIAVRRRLTATLGEPLQACQLTPSGADGARMVVHSLRWEGRGRGAVVTYTYSPTPDESLADALRRFTTGSLSLAAEPATESSSDSLSCG